MASESEVDLTIRLEARITQFERDLRRVKRITDENLGGAERRARRSAENFGRAGREAGQRFSSGLRSAIAAIGVGMSVKEVMAYADAWTSAGNRLKAVGIEVDAAAAKQDELVNLAMRSRTEYGAVVDLYARLTSATSDMGVSQAEVARVTETVSKALTLSGASAAEASSAITQLGQALGAGALRGEELNSILEASRPLAELIAREFGVTVGQLKKLGEQGALTADRVFKAIINGSKGIDETFSKTNATIAQSFTNLETKLVQYIGKTDQAHSASARVAAALNNLAENFDEVADTVANLVTAFGIFMGARGLVGLVAGTASAIAQFRLFLTAGGSIAALLSGPVGIAIAATAAGLYLLAQRSTESTDAAAKHHAAMLKVEDVMYGVATATGVAANAALADRDAMLANAEAALAATAAKLKLIETNEKLARVRAAAEDAADPEASHFYANQIESTFRALGGAAAVREMQSLQAQIAALRAQPVKSSGRLVVSGKPVSSAAFGSGGGGGGGGAAGKTAEAKALADATKELVGWQTEVISSSRELRVSYDEEAAAIRDLLDPTREYTRKMERVRELERIGALGHDDATARIKQLTDEMNKAGDAAEDNGAIIVDAFSQVGDTILANIRNVDDLKIAIAQLALQAIAGKGPLGDLFNQMAGGAPGTASGTGGLLGMLFKAGFSGVSAYFGGGGAGTTPGATHVSGAGFYASGGMYPAGMPRITGERGPEIDIPSRSGVVIPANITSRLLRGGMNGGSSAPVIQIDARGATNPAAIEAAARRGAESAVRALSAPGREAWRRN